MDSDFWPKQSAIITGGGGFLGAAIIDGLIKLNCGKISAIGRTPKPNLAKLGVEFKSCDIRDKDAVRNALKSQSIVFHCAAKAGVWGPPQEYLDTNLGGTRNVIAAAKANDIHILIHTSSPSAATPEDGSEGLDETASPPQQFMTSYPLSKALAEKEALAANSTSLAVTVIRPPLIWGPGDPHLLPRLIEKAKARRLVQVGDGSNFVDLTFVRNAAAAHIIAAEKAAYKDSPTIGKAFFISDDQPVKLWDWINDFLSMLGLPKTTRRIPYPAAFAAGCAMEAAWKILRLDGEPPITRFVAAQLAKPRHFDISAARCILGYAPAVPPDQALAETVEFFKENI